MLSNIPTLTLPLSQLPSRVAHTEPDNDHLHVFTPSPLSLPSLRGYMLFAAKLSLSGSVSARQLWKQWCCCMGWECNRGTGVLSVLYRLYYYGSAYKSYTKPFFYTRGLGIVNVFYLSWLLNLTGFPWFFAVGNNLKGQCHEIFCFWFFSWISFPQAPDYTVRAVSNFFENSRRYS